MDSDKIKEYLTELHDKLTSEENWKPLLLTQDWIMAAPNAAGVYTIRNNEKIVYVGETGNLQSRMKDLTETRNHSVRRTLGKKLFASNDAFKEATTKKKFPYEIEKLLDDYMRENLEIATLNVELGRKELEELIVSEIPKDIMLNNRGKRKAKKHSKI